MRPTLRLVAAAAAAGAWLGLLLAGWAGGGAVHLLAVAALALAPWREPALPREDR
jgi:hypothetical protein